jgi:hypothetical protein
VIVCRAGNLHKIVSDSLPFSSYDIQKMKQINAFIYMLLLSLNIFHNNHNLLFKKTRDCQLINFFPFSHYFFMHFGSCKTDFSIQSSSSQQMLKATSLCMQAHLAMEFLTSMNSLGWPLMSSAVTRIRRKRTSRSSTSVA